MAKRDYYATLEVGRDADAEGLKKAYRKLAMKYHPDRNPGDKQAEASFKECSEAYEVLRDPQKRALYDRLGHAAFEQGGGGFGGGGFEFSGAGGLGDIFDQMFGDFVGGGRGGAPAPARICKPRSKSNSRRLSPAQRPRFACRPGSAARPAKAQARPTGSVRRSIARPAMARARCGRSRVFF
jgi:DnaJ-class molecular chaperone